MKRAVLFAVVFAVALFIAPRIHVPGIGSAWAVEPPSPEQQQKAKAAHEKQKKEKGKEIKQSGCPYGKDVNTGKCYQPKEGEFYEDSEGNIHRKETTCYNLPWKPCNSATKAAEGKPKGTKKTKGK